MRLGSQVKAIREAVGDLVCGISGYKLYELTLEHRKLDVEYQAANSKLTALLKSLNSDDALSTPASIHGQVTSLQSELVRLETEISAVDEMVQPGEVSEFLKAKLTAKKRLERAADDLQVTENIVSTTTYELREIEEFAEHLSELRLKLTRAEATFVAVGEVEFTHCPSCGEPIEVAQDEGHCHLCKSKSDPEVEKSRYNQIRFDLEIQLRETIELLQEKRTARDRGNQELRQLKSTHQKLLKDYSLRYSGSSEPREAYLAQRTNRLGHIDAEIGHLLGKLDLAEEISKLSEEKEELNRRLTVSSAEIKSLRASAAQRRGVALSQAGTIAASLLKEGIAGQPEFDRADHVKIDFITDSMAVDGTINFAESSNVFLKNATVFALFLAAGRNKHFFHPHFLLMDNIEDKGMQEARSHHFQKMLVEHSTELPGQFQLIFTTSMMNPELELDDYVIGPAYSKTNRSLDLGIPRAVNSRE